MDNVILLLKEKKLEIKSDLLEGVININKEEHTIGNLLNRGLQQHEKISFGGYNIVHPLDKKIEIYYKLKKSDNIISVMEDVVKYYTDIFTKIKSKL